MEEVEVLDRAEINDGKVIIEYSRTEAALAELRTKYQGVVFDCATTKGDKKARAARLELTTLRTRLNKKRKEFKAPVLELGKKIDAEAARITSEILAIETPIDNQIKADEKRRAEEKAERERIEAERIKTIKDKIATIRSFVAKCQGISSERIANGIDMVGKIGTGADEFAEFQSEAVDAKAETLAAMRELFAAAKSREEEAARVEAQRIENERIAQEQRVAAEKLAAERAELERQQRAQAEALAAQQAEINRREAELKAEQERIAQEAAKAAQQAIEDAKAAEQEVEPVNQSPVFVSHKTASVNAPAQVVNEDDGERLKVTEKCYSLNDEDFIYTDLGEVIDAMEDPQVGSVYFEADMERLDSTKGINRFTVDSILENMDELIYEVLGECYDNDYSNASNEEKAELLALLEAWATKHIDLSQYWEIVGKTRECKLTADDIEHIKS